MLNYDEKTFHFWERSIASYNINSLQSKFVEVKEWLDQRVFDILTIQKTKIDRTYPKSQFRVEHYKLYRKDRMKGGEA